MGFLATAWTTTAAYLSGGVVRGWSRRYAALRKYDPEDSAVFWEWVVRWFSGWTCMARFGGRVAWSGWPATVSSLALWSSLPPPTLLSV